MVGLPLFTLVEDDTGREVKLLDHLGQPSAMPISQKMVDEDHRYNYVDGSIGKSPLVQRHEIQLGVDFLPDAIRRRLMRMRMDRKSVLFTPGWGERTVMAWRPVEANGSTAPSGDTWKDLTGNVTLTSSASTGATVCDTWTERTVKEIAPSGANPALVVETPYGAGQAMQNTVTNRWSPGVPEGDDEGFQSTFPVTYPAGWEKGGTGASQITFSFVSGGITEIDEDALRVTTTDDVSISRYIEAEDLWDAASFDHVYTFSGTSLLSVSMIIKGRLPENAVLNLSAMDISTGNPTDTVSIPLDGDYGNATVVSANLYADWSANRPRVYINLLSATGEPADFMVTRMTATLAVWGASRRYSDYGTATVGECVTSESITKPKVGSVTMSFYLPEDLPTDTTNYCLAMLDPSNAYHGQLTVNRSGTSDPYVAFYYNGSTNRLRGYPADLGAGIHAVTASWGTGHLALYYDGELLEESTTDFDIDFTDNGTVSIASSSRGAWPIIPLTFRLDSETHADDYADIHAALIDSVSLGTIVAARGRAYEITSLPSTPRLVDGATYWTGTITLSQVGYDSDLADVTTKEY